MEKINAEDIKSLIENDQEFITNNITGEVQWIKQEQPIDEEIKNTEFEVKQEDIDNDGLDEMFDENKIPDSLIDEPDRDIQDDMILSRDVRNIGLKPEDFADLYEYVAGNSKKPEFTERFLADANDRLKRMLVSVNLYQLSKLPELIALNDYTRRKLYSEKKFEMLDTGDMVSLSSNLDKATYNTIRNSIDMLNTLKNTDGGLSSEYRQLIDSILMLPEDKLNKIIQAVEENKPEDI